jgi:hypothetical protein
VVGAVMMGQAVVTPVHVHASVAQRVEAGGGAVPARSCLQTASRRHWVRAQHMLTQLACRMHLLCKACNVGQYLREGKLCA